jgi:ubiquinone/menaquinone biosynthesis C-methylase UbiE
VSAPWSAARDFKERDAASYDEVTAEFDRFVERLSPPLARRIVALGEVRSGERVLDVGTGTGIVALHAADAVGAAGRVVGIDLSARMLAVARGKAQSAGVEARLELKRMDAEALELEDRAFDVVLSLFALLHFPAPLAALAEMRRVLRPGGRLVVAVGSRPPLASRSALEHYVRQAPALVATLAGRRLSAPGLLNELLDRYAPPAEVPQEADAARAGPDRSRRVLAMVRRSGFVDARWHWEGHELVADGPDEFWDVQRTFSTVARKRLAACAPGVVAAIRAEFGSRCRATLERGGRLVYPFGAFFVAARRGPDEP